MTPTTTIPLDHTQQERADLETAAGRAYVVRYVVTKINRAGMRDLADPMQGRHTYDTPDGAAAWLECLQNAAALAPAYGDAARLAVRAVACYPGHHDPIGRYFDYDEALTSEHLFVPVEAQTGCARCGYARGHHPTAAMIRAAERAGGAR